MLQKAQKREDISDYMFNMSIETYEIFIRILTAVQQINGFDLLMNYNKYREKMSLKTYLHRIDKKLKLDTRFFQKIVLESQEEYLSFIGADSTF